MLRWVVRVIWPEPPTAEARTAPALRLIVPDEYANRDLPIPALKAPLKVTVLKSLAGEPMNRLEFRSGDKAPTAIVSAALPRLIWSELVGLLKSVVSKVPPLLKRDMPLPEVPSSARVAAFVGPEGRLKVTSLAVPVFVIGS